MGLASSWDDLRFFLAVHREGSMGRAAERLGVNASTVSRRLAALEEALSLRLFERLPDGTRLTEEGAALLGPAQEIEAAHGALSRRASSARGAVSGRVRVALVPSLARQLVKELGPLFAEHPHVIVELVTGERVANLVQREADISVRFVPPEQQELRARALGAYGWGVFASPAYWRGREALSAQALDWVCYEHPRIETPMTQWTAAHVPEARKRLTTYDLTVMVEAVAAGLGVALLPLPIARADRSLLRVVIDCPLPPPTPMWIVAHQDLNAIARIRVVWDYLIGVFGGITPEQT
jgi:DNA-binding transcriptional LysR family regulator